jgi:hypothetical protein
MLGLAYYKTYLCREDFNREAVCCSPLRRNSLLLVLIRFILLSSIRLLSAFWLFFEVFQKIGGLAMFYHRLPPFFYQILSSLDDHFRSLLQSV